MGGAGVKPNVHDILLFIKGGGAALFALGARREDILRVQLIPGVASLFPEQPGNRQHSLLIDQRLAAFLAEENRDRNPPFSLTGNAPVSPVPDHGCNPILAPGGNPLDILDRFYRVLLKVLHRAEPLLGSPEQHWVFASPAVRILVDDFFHGEQGTRFLQVLRDGRIGLAGGQAGKFFTGLLGHSAQRIHRHDHRDIRIILADVKVVHTVAGSRMDAAGAAFQGNMVADDHQRGPVDKRMGGLHVFQILALNGSYDLISGFSGGLHRGFVQGLRHHVVLVFPLDQAVGKIRTYADRVVSGQSPGGGGPNDEIGLTQIRSHLCQQALIVGHQEFHINGVARILGVLDFRFRQSGLAVGAPVNRL